jgi:hypothetical protein
MDATRKRLCLVLFMVMVLLVLNVVAVVSGHASLLYHEMTAPSRNGC